MHFRDTAELHSMAGRNHFEWATPDDDEFKVGRFTEAAKFRREAVGAANRSNEVIKRIPFVKESRGINREIQHNRFEENLV